MKFVITELTASNLADVDKCDGEFVINSKIILHFEGDQVSYTAVPHPPTTKQYQPDHIHYPDYLNDLDKIVYMAYVDGRPAGQIVLRKSWNNYAYIDYIVVDKAYRRHQIGQALINRAKEWASQKQLGGLMLETQTNNVQACQFYKSCGFEIGGFDKFLYKAQDTDIDETAVFWYYFL